MKRAAVLVCATALLVAVSVAAATAANPSKLILLKKDFPAHADYDNSAGNDLDLKATLEKKGLTVTDAGYLAATYSGKQGMVQIKGVVVATSGLGAAKRALVIVAGHQQALWKTLGAPFKPTTGIPKYGDDQQAFATKPSVMHNGVIDVIVRRRTLVWLLEIVVQRDPPAKMSDVAGYLKTYAAKQKARIG